MRRASFVITAVAALCVGLAAPGFARDDQLDTVAGHTNRELPPSTVDKITTTGTLVPATARTAADGAGYDCVKKTTASSQLKAYVPWHIDYSSTSWEVHYTDFFYRVPNARVVSGVWTTQFEQCVIGGSRNKHSYQRMAGTDSEVSVTGSTNHLIGYKWGTAVDSGAVKATLGFKVALSKATSISGSLPLSTGGHETGGIGAGICGNLSGNSGNQVNGQWKYTYPGFGTNDFKGNVSHALYEYQGGNITSMVPQFQACRQARY